MSQTVRPPPGLPILDRMSDDLKADAVEQRCIFVRAQAGVIERVAPILPRLSPWADPLLNISTADGAACRANTLNIRRWSSGLRWRGG